jgi:hypothetical protein
MTLAREAVVIALYGLLVLNILAGAAVLLWYALWNPGEDIE